MVKLASRRRARRTPKRLSPPDADLPLYDGRHLLGTILRRGKVFRAVGGAGKKLGEFATLGEACNAIRGAFVSTP